MCGDLENVEELQEAVTMLLCKLILGKEDDFVRAEAVIDIQGYPDYFCATFGDLEGVEEWVSETMH